MTQKLETPVVYGIACHSHMGTVLLGFRTSWNGPAELYQTDSHSAAVAKMAEYANVKGCTYSIVKLPALMGPTVPDTRVKPAMTIARDDITTLISRIQGHRNRAKLGPEYLADTVAHLRLAYRANGRQRAYWVEAALILFRQGA